MAAEPGRASGSDEAPGALDAVAARGEALDLDSLAGLRGVDDPALADVEADVSKPVEEDEVTWLESGSTVSRDREALVRVV